MFVYFIGGSTSAAKSPFNLGHLSPGTTAVHVQGRKIVQDAVPWSALKWAEVRDSVCLELV
jgi:hypothetical protein